MKTLRLALTFAVSLTLGWLSVGCAHGQVTPTPQKNVSLTWTAPTSPACTTSAPCTYDVSRISLASGATTCPVPNVTTPNYTPQNSANPASGTTYTDTAAAGLTACYIVQTVQGGQVSQPSNTAGPFVVPSVPGAPSINGSVAESKQPAIPQPTGTAAPVLTAKLVPVR